MSVRTAAAPDHAPAATPSARSERADSRWGASPFAALVMALAVLVVAVGYDRGRAGHPGAVALAWAGQIAVVVPVAVRLAQRRALAALEGFGLVVALAVAQYTIKINYSPEQFRFPDELQHWRTTTDALTANRLMTPNDALPIASHYPGLEAAAVAISRLTGLDVHGTGLVLAGTAHVLLLAAVYLLAARLLRSSRLAVLACLVYATNPHDQFFDAMYLYQALALPFLVLALWAARVWQRGAGRATAGGLVGVGVTAVLVVTVTHHVTSLVLVGGLLVVAASVLACTRDPRPLVLAGTALAAVALWTAAVAPDLVGYLKPAMDGPVQGLLRLLSGSTSPGGSTAVPTPMWLRGLSLAALAMLAVLVPVGWWALRRRQPGDPWTPVLVVGSALLYATGVLRLVSLDGAELSGRALSFVYLPVALVVAAAAGAGLAAAGAGRRLAAAGLVPGAMLIQAGALAAGWPPSYELVPGRYLPGAFERSVDGPGVAVARWAGAQLPPGGRFATDAAGYALLAGYGDQDTVRESGLLFIHPEPTPATKELIARLSIRYVAVDRRLATASPASGTYFPASVPGESARHPIPAADLAAFDRVDGVSRLYDSGVVQVYDLRGSDYER